MLDALHRNIVRALFTLRTSIQPDKFNAPVFDYYHRGESHLRRALILYRALPFHLASNHPVYSYHQSMIQSKLIAESLDHLSFRVDVADFHSGFEPRTDYDLVICHNSSEDPTKKEYRGAKKIYLATGTEHRTHNLRQQSRLEAFEKRQGHHDILLQWDEETMPWTEKADAIFCFGNEAVAETWRERFGDPVMPFENTSLKTLPDLKRNWNEEKKHFLFLGSAQQLAKGLDLLLEAFSQCPDLHLHVCGHYLKDKAFCKVYEKILFDSPNIHSHGWVDVTSDKFFKMAANCAFTISSSCAEGSPGSITNCMRLGMIPLLSREAGISAGNGVVLLADLSIPGIIASITTISGADRDRLKDLSDSATQRARSDFSESAFRSRWIDMISNVLEES
jgi:glycosyltransferase involved in cell wall biosynthesis